MTHADIAAQVVQIVFIKGLVDKPHSLVAHHFSLRAFRVADCDAAALLPPVLQGKKSVIDRGSYILLTGEIIHAKNAAFLARFVKDLSSVKYSIVLLMQIVLPL